MRKTLLACIVALSAAALGAFGLSADLRSVEMDIVVRTDGKADFYESLDWQVAGGLMHGFYFQGAAVRPVFNRDQCYADLGDRKRVGLDITDLGSGRYDVVLAGRQGFTGRAMYFLAYGGDLAGAGLIGWTKSADFGELFYFDWAAEQWDQPLEHRTVRILLPVTVAGEKLASGSLATLGFRTEPFVNQENAIDAFGTKGTDGSYYLTLRFNQDGVAPRQTQRLQFYLKKSAIPMQPGLLTQSTPAGQGAAPAGQGATPPSGGTPTTGAQEQTPGRPGAEAPAAAEPRARLSPEVMGIVLGALLIAILLLYVLKARGYGRTM